MPTCSPLSALVRLPRSRPLMIWMERRWVARFAKLDHLFRHGAATLCGEPRPPVEESCLSVEQFGAGGVYSFAGDSGVFAHVARFRPKDFSKGLARTYREVERRAGMMSVNATSRGDRIPYADWRGNNRVSRTV